MESRETHQTLSTSSDKVSVGNTETGCGEGINRRINGWRCKWTRSWMDEERLEKYLHCSFDVSIVSTSEVWWSANNTSSSHHPPGHTITAHSNHSHREVVGLSYINCDKNTNVAINFFCMLFLFLQAREHGKIVWHFWIIKSLLLDAFNPLAAVRLSLLDLKLHRNRGVLLSISSRLKLFHI